MNQHKISLTTAILMNFNIMIGSGILIGPAIMAEKAGNASFLAWLLVALIFLPIVLSTVQMSRMCPGAGGFYAYAKEGLSIPAGYWSGWLYIVGYTFSFAVELLALRSTLLTSLGENWFTMNPVIFNAGFTLAAVGLNLLGMKLFSRILNSLTVSKLLPLIVLILLIPMIYNPSFTITAHELSMVPLALPFAIFGYLGFEYCCSISHLIENSEKNAPLALLIGFFLTATIYSLFHFGLLNLMGPQALHEFGAPSFAQFLNVPIPYLKSVLSYIIPLASVATLFAGACGLLNANSIMLNSMAHEKLFVIWPVLAQVSSLNRPWAALFIQGFVGFLIGTLLPNIEVVGNLCNMGVFLSFILPLCSLFAIQTRTGKQGNRLLTIFGLISAASLSIYSIFRLMSISPLWSDRLFYLSPFIGLLVIGALIFRNRGDDFRKLDESIRRA
ncbi:APC family permease [Candidatus Dependentiae bacterium]|nr:APC family permease [Candidatus Dependentiae bacterium]